jgi:hypothetical protein
MLTGWRIGVAASVSLALTCTAAASVAAADDVFGSVACAQSAAPVCTLSAGTIGTRSGGSAAGAGSGSGQAPQESRPTASTQAVAPDPDDQGGPEVGSASSPVPEFATRQLRLPAPEISVNPVGTQLVNVPTWLWLSAGWAPVSVRFEVPGVSMSATATPTLASWSMGDGTIETCTGPGTPFHQGLDPNSPSPDCGHLYRVSSANQPGQVFVVTVTVHWRIAWSGAGRTGTYPDMTTTSSTFLKVAEGQALVTGRCPPTHLC